ncbi:MAG TPA: DUF2080 family transposase-associated protein [Methanoregulaceae archaeon]|nr:DUF2080 family transposase-associated protein [Methanoregulaceae archaeon]
MQRRKITVDGYGTLDATVGRSGPSAGRVYVPKEWIGRPVLVVLLSDLDKPLSTPSSEK